MEYKHLTILANAYAAHTNRSLVTVAKRIGVHNKLFSRLVEVGGCRVDTFNQAMMWFDLNWPADLQWPEAVPRKRLKAIAARGSAA
jgi:hypothetical protein